MADMNFPLTIPRKDEEMVRKAAKQVDHLLNVYREHYRNVSERQVLVMVAYQLSLDSLRMQERNDTEPFTAKIKELTETLEDYFKKE